ncbi:MAG: hypothetical protein JWQ04_2907 [Pedosphaera sp.]|nr:hypothetical protein [Pedosphaera sp.]
MSKLRSDSLWNELTPEQWETLESWLFDENIGYKEAHERILKEWGLTRSISGLARFYRHCAEERAVGGMPETLEAVRRINETGASLDELRNSTLKIMSKRFFEQALEAKDLKQLTALGRLMNESEEREIRRQRVALARDRWEFDAAKAALKALPQLNDFSQEEEQRDLARIEALKRTLFGKEVDLIENSR